MNVDGYKLLAEGGYASVYIDDTAERVVKVLSRYVVEGENKFINYTSIIDLSMHKTFDIPGMAKICSYTITDENIVMEMPYYGKPINKQTIPHDAVARIVMQLVVTLLHLFHNGIQHTDIKPCNVLYDARNETTTLIDFNMMSCEILKNGLRKWTSSYGTWSYSAPEIVHLARPYDTSMVWSVGMIIAFLYNRFPLPGIQHKSQTEISSRTFWKRTLLDLQEKHPDSFPLPSTHVSVMPDFMTEIFRECTQWNPDTRCTLQTVYDKLCFYIHGSLCEFVPRVFHHEVIPYESSSHVRTKVVERLHKFMQEARLAHVFSRTIVLFDRAMSSCSYNNVNQIMTACIFLVLMLMGHYVFDTLGFVHKTLKYWEIPDDLEVVQAAIWDICDKLEWGLWERPFDAYLPKNNVLKERFTNVTHMYTVDELARGI
jgi:serine/threonine protein kinase